MSARTRRQLALLNRVARLRDAERNAALRDAARMNAAHARLQALSKRMDDIGTVRPDGTGAQSAASLRNSSAFGAALQNLARDTAKQTARAQLECSAAMERLGTAQHRRDTVRERAAALSHTLGLATLHSASPDLARKLNSKPKQGAERRTESRNLT